MPTYPSPKPAWTIKAKCWLREGGWGGTQFSFPKCWKHSLKRFSGTKGSFFFFPRLTFFSLLMILLSLFLDLKSRFRRTSCSSWIKLLFVLSCFRFKGNIFHHRETYDISIYRSTYQYFTCVFCLLAWLVRLWEIMNSGGILIIKTNVSWDLESLKAVLGTR